MPSFTTIISILVCAYIAHSVYSISRLFATPTCSQAPCFRSYLESRPVLQVCLFVSPKSSPVAAEVEHVYTFRKFDYSTETERCISLDPIECPATAPIISYTFCPQNLWRDDSGPNEAQRIPGATRRIGGRWRWKVDVEYTETGRSDRHSEDFVDRLCRPKSGHV